MKVVESMEKTNEANSISASSTRRRGHGTTRCSACYGYCDPDLPLLPALSHQSSHNVVDPNP